MEMDWTIKGALLLKIAFKSLIQLIKVNMLLIENNWHSQGATKLFPNQQHIIIIEIW